MLGHFPPLVGTSGLTLKPVSPPDGLERAPTLSQSPPDGPYGAPVLGQSSILMDHMQCMLVGGEGATSAKVVGPAAGTTWAQQRGLLGPSSGDYWALAGSVLATVASVGPLIQQPASPIQPPSQVRYHLTRHEMSCLPKRPHPSDLPPHLL